jgi:hypothetical protein
MRLELKPITKTVPFSLLAASEGRTSKIRITAVKTGIRDLYLLSIIVILSTLKRHLFFIKIAKQYKYVTTQLYKKMTFSWTKLNGCVPAAFDGKDALFEVLVNRVIIAI